jgi:hypothetical protein
MYEKAGYKIVGDMKFMLGGLALKDWVLVKLGEGRIALWFAVYSYFLAG